MKFDDLEVGMVIYMFDEFQSIIVTAVGENTFLCKSINPTRDDDGEFQFKSNLGLWNEKVIPFLVVGQLYEDRTDYVKAICSDNVIVSHIGELHVLFHYVDGDHGEQCLTIEDFTDMYEKVK